MTNEVDWDKINYQKELSIAWMNAMNNAAIIVSACIPEMAVKDEKLFLEKLRFIRDEIYKLNVAKIDYDAAQTISQENFAEK